MRVLFLTFGDGTDDFRAASLRLMEQAQSIEVYNLAIGLNHEGLLAASPEYVDAQSSIVQLDTYPKSFRAAKAWVIQAGLLGYFGKFDVVCYADSGCEIVSNPVTRLILKLHVQRAYKHGGLAEQLPSSERDWTKKRTLDYFQTSLADSLSGHVQATWSFWRVDKENIELVNRWCALSDSELDLWQDPKDRNEEAEYFKEHRHDQSLFSLLWKDAGLPMKTVSGEWELRLGKVRGACIPIHTLRNRTGTPTLNKLSESTFFALLGLFLNLIGKCSLCKRIMSRAPKS